VNAVLLSLVTLFSTSAGGYCAFRLRDRLHWVLALTAGVLLGVVVFDLLPESLALARATLRTIKQNLFWAFFYNAAGIPLAALGFLSPVLCAAAMGLSDLIVIGNALRLRWRKF